jgi:S1-C subfamily serine protease
MRFNSLPLILTIVTCLSGAVDAQVVDFRAAVNKASPSIVAVYSHREAQGPVRRQRTEDATKAPNMPGMRWLERRSNASGRDSNSTGIVVGDKRVLTLAHGTPDTTYQIGLSDGSKLDAKVIAYDEVTDGVLLEVSKDVGPPFELSANGLELGQPLAAIWAKLDGEPTVGQGIVSSRANWEPSLNHVAFEADFSIAMGASGGAVCDQHGSLVGIIAATGQGMDRASTWVVPVDQITRLLVESGNDRKGDEDATLTLRRGTMGVFLRERTNEAQGLVDDSPADKAGIEVGDRVLSVNGSPTMNSAQLFAELSKFRAGDKVQLRCKRGEVDRNVDLVLTATERASKESRLRFQPDREWNWEDDWSKFSEELRQRYQVPKGFEWSIDPNTVPRFVPAPPVAPRLQIERSDLEESIRDLRREIDELRQELKGKLKQP